MNRAFLIVLVPALLVAAGYIAIFRYMGVPPGYGRLAGAMVLLVGWIWWLGKRNKKSSNAAN